MKTLYLMRHAKSDRSLGLPDFQRPLNNRGLEDAPIMGKFLRKSGKTPDKIMASSAKRAQQTAILFKDASHYSNEIEWHDEFYLCEIEIILNVLHVQSDQLNSLMVVAHNPTLEQLSSHLLGKDQLNLEMPTSCIVCLEMYSSNWAKLSYGRMVLKWMLIPRIVKK